ncbi:MAG: tRNA lysidine(34) synthetase TilS [Desulfobacterales bacterium]|nr:tRNA lysidine(34) synthetase TilS [Desulfobacterales bacterium]
MPALRQSLKIKRILHIVEQTIVEYEMFQAGDSVLVGVSGGPDSVALLHILQTLADRFSIMRLGIAHLNHCLRRKDSDNDAEFVASLAAKIGLPFYQKAANVLKYQSIHKLSLEEAARQVRYAFLKHIAEKNGYKKIALGHHSDDNAELILMNFLRGSGPLGISGIPPVRDELIVRPLSRLMRTDILNYVNEKGLKFIVDDSNNDFKYLRNKIRHHLIPILKASYNPRIIETLNRFGSVMKYEDKWIEKAIEPNFEKSVLAMEIEKIILSVPRLNKIDPAAKRRIIRRAIQKIKGNLRRITFLHIDSALNLLEHGSLFWSLDLPDRIRLKRTGDLLLIIKEKKALRDSTEPAQGADDFTFEYKIFKPQLKPQLTVIKETGDSIRSSCMVIKKPFNHPLTGQQVAFFDMEELEFPLTVRNFRPGDCFNPLGMTGTQKVKTFFINNKVSRFERIRCPILLSRECIIWVAGYRIAGSVKVKPSTRYVVKMELLLA